MASCKPPREPTHYIDTYYITFHLIIISILLQCTTVQPLTHKIALRSVTVLYDMVTLEAHAQQLS